MRKIAVIVAFVSLSSAVVVSGQIQINEIAYEEWYRTDSDLDYGAGWVEIKNVSDNPINGADFRLALNNNEPWSLPTATLAPGGYWMIWLSGKNRSADINDLHATFTVEGKLNIFKIVSGVSDVVVDSILISTRPYWNETHARFPENSNRWYNVTTTTPGTLNVALGSWRRVSTLSDFYPRDSAPNASLYFKNKFWILEGWPGGGGEEVASSAVWTSANASEWTKVCEFPPYHPYSGYVVFQGYMWAFDGSAFRSSDGVEWTEVGENLPFTTNSRVAVLNDYLVSVKGSSVYKSLDGITWTEQTNNAPWGYREFPGFVSFNGKLWIFGGGINYFTGSDYYFNDVWSSTDAVHWTKEVYDAEWSGRLWFGYTVFDNKIWLMGGWNYHDKENALYGNRDDVWFSSNGTKWERLNSSTTWAPRHAPFAWASPTNLYISCGFLNTYGLFNDIWTLEKLDEGISNEFYLQEGTDPRDLSSWGTNKSGSGFRPSGFGFDKQLFHVSNDDSIEFDKKWSVTGNNTRVIFGNGTDSTSVVHQPGVDFHANVELTAKTTYSISGANLTPYIVKADSSSLLSIANGDIRLHAAALGRLNITNATVDLLENCTIGAGLDITEDVLVKGESFQYHPAAKLTYTGDDHSASASEWSFAKPPGHVIVNLDGKLQVSDHIRADSVTLLHGKVKIDSGSLLVNHIEGVTNETYFVTGKNGYLKMPVGADQRLFPIGTDSSYAPVEIKFADAGVDDERIMIASSILFDSLRHEDYAVKTGWFVGEGSEDPAAGQILSPSDKYLLIAHWDVKSEGVKLTSENLALKQLDLGIWVTRTVAQPSASTIEGTRQLAATLGSYGLFTVQDYRTDLTYNVSFFPNPAVEYIEIAFKTPTEDFVEVNMVNSMGQRAISLTFEPGYLFYRIELGTNLTSGLYIMNVKSDFGVYAERILIKN